MLKCITKVASHGICLSKIWDINLFAWTVLVNEFSVQLKSPSLCWGCNLSTSIDLWSCSSPHATNNWIHIDISRYQIKCILCIWYHLSVEKKGLDDVINVSALKNYIHIWSEISNHIQGFLWNITTNPCPYFSVPLRSRHGWVIAIYISKNL